MTNAPAPTDRNWRLLQAYAGVTTLALALLAVAAFRSATPAAADVLTARRINIVGPDGKLQLVISNRQDMPEGYIDGKTFASQGRHDNAGVIFYNADGDEDGGMTFGDKHGAKGTSADGGLMFDQYKQDQKIGLGIDWRGGRAAS